MNVPARGSPDAAGPRAKIDEELAELDRSASPDEQKHELGDLLFSIVNLARHFGIDPESALRESTQRFEDRFRRVERTAEKPLHQMSIDELELLWQRAKQQR